MTNSTTEMHQPGCQSCATLKKELSDVVLKNDQVQSIAKSIVQTDLLFRKQAELEKELTRVRQELSSKSEECNSLKETNKLILKEKDGLAKRNKEQGMELTSLQKRLDDVSIKLKTAAQNEKNLESQLRSANEKRAEVEKESQKHRLDLSNVRNEFNELTAAYEKLQNELELMRTELKKKEELVKKEEPKVESPVKLVKAVTVEPVKESVPKASFYLSSSESEEEMVLEKSKETNDVSKPPTSTNDPFKFSSLSDDEDSSSESESSSSSSSSSSQAGSKSSEDESDDSDDEKEQPPSSESLVLKDQQVEELKQSEPNNDKEMEERVNLVHDKVRSEIIETLIDDAVNQGTNESFILEFIIDKLINEEVGNKNTRFISLCQTSIEEHRQDLRQADKQFKRELALKMESELLDKIIEHTVDPLMRECCDRVLEEAKRELIEEIYTSVCDDVVKNLLETYLLENIFDEMTSLKKPLLERIKPLPPVPTPLSPPRPVQHAPVERAELVDAAKKRRMSNENELVAEKDNKKVKVESSYPCVNESNYTAQEIKQIQNYLRDCLGDYFRKYNFKVQFTLAELDEIIGRMVRIAQYRRDNFIQVDPRFYCQIISKALIKHYVNNNFIPLDPTKLKQSDDADVALFRQIKLLKSQIHTPMANPSPASSTSSTPSESYFNYLQARLHDSLIRRITYEEEKYIYLIKKLKEYPSFDRIVDQFLNELKLIILTNQFNDDYNARFGRMICFICREIKHSSFMRCLIFDLIMAHFTLNSSIDYSNMIVLFVRIWPEAFIWPYSVLSYDDAEENYEDMIKKNPVLYVVIYLVKNSIWKSTLTKQESDSLKFNIYVLETLCNWAINVVDAKEVMSFLISNLREENVISHKIFIVNEFEFKLNEPMFEYMHAIQLLATSQKDLSFLALLSQEIESLRLKMKDASRGELTESLLAFYLIVQANVIAKKTGSSNAIYLSSDHFIDQVNSILAEDHKSRIVELACIESLIALVHVSPVRSVQVIQRFGEGVESSNYPQSIKQKIKSTG